MSFKWPFMLRKTHKNIINSIEKEYKDHIEKIMGTQNTYIVGQPEVRRTEWIENKEDIITTTQYCKTYGFSFCGYFPTPESKQDIAEKCKNKIIYSLNQEEQKTQVNNEK